METRNLCQTCLSSDRNLYLISNLKILLLDSNMTELTNCPGGLCFECVSCLRNMAAFKKKAMASQNILKGYLQVQGIAGLSTLSSTPVTFHNFTLEEEQPLITAEANIKTETIDPLVTVKIELDIKDESVDEDFDDNETSQIEINDGVIKDQFESTEDPLQKVYSSNLDKLEEVTKNIDIKKAGTVTVTPLRINELTMLNEDDKIKDMFTMVQLTDEEVTRVRETKRNNHNFKKLPFKCEFCVVGFMSKEKFEWHNKTKHDESNGSHSCPVCQIRYINYNHMETHRSKHYAKYRCKLCTHEVTEVFTMINHCRTKHEGDTTDRIHCAHCDVVASNAEEMNKHMSDHHGAICDSCGLKFKQKRTLAMHINKRCPYRPRLKGGHTKNAMMKALRQIQKGVSVRAAAKKARIPYATVRRYHLISKTCSSIESMRLVPNYEVNQIFNTGQEERLVECYKECASAFYGLTNNERRRVAYQMAKCNGVKIPQRWEKEKMAGKDWLRSFRQRHKNIGASRSITVAKLKKDHFDKFYGDLEMLSQGDFKDRNRIFNLNEIPIPMVGQKSQRVNKSQGTFGTMCCVICADGSSLHPVLIFPRNRINSLVNSTSNDILRLTTSSGCLTAEIFPEVMKHFIKKSNSSLQNPCILIMDNHETHLSLEALDLAKSAGVHILLLHIHSSGKLQPFQCLHESIKTFFNTNNSLSLLNLESSVQQCEIEEIIEKFSLEVLTPVAITDAFKNCGVFPFDRNLFDDEEFMQSSVDKCPDDMEEDTDQIMLELTRVLIPEDHTMTSKYTEDTNCEEDQNDHEALAPRTTDFIFVAEEISIDSTESLEKLVEDAKEQSSSIQGSTCMDEDLDLSPESPRRIHSPGREYSCDVCKKRFVTKSRLESHVTSHSDFIAQSLAFCTLCRVQYKNIQVYRSHLRTSAMHAERSYKCLECNKLFTSKLYLKRHHNFVHLHKSKYKCEECGKLCISEWRLKNHRHVRHDNTRSRDYGCDVCGKRFFTQSILKGHQLTHSDHRGFVCAECGMSFKQSAALYTHNRLVHKKGKKKNG